MLAKAILEIQDAIVIEKNGGDFVEGDDLEMASKMALLSFAKMDEDEKQKCFEGMKYSEEYIRDACSEWAGKYLGESPICEGHDSTVVNDWLYRAGGIPDESLIEKELVHLARRWMNYKESGCDTLASQTVSDLCDLTTAMRNL